MGSTSTKIDNAKQCQPRQFQKFVLVWVDANAYSNASDDTQNTVQYLRSIVDDVKLIDQPDECIGILQRMVSKKSFVILSGSFGQNLVPRIHDIPGLDSIYIYCCNKQYHEQWSCVWKKVRAVETDIFLIAEALIMAVKRSKQNDISMSIIDFGDESETDLDRLEPSFLHSSLLKNAILNMNHDLKEEMTIFTMNALKKSKEKDEDAKALADFRDNYCADRAIFWYTKETFLYGLLNAALRNLEGDVIVDMGFFIRDLHWQLEQLHQQQLSIFGSKPFVLYRGQGLPKEKFMQWNKNKGGLLGFNNFLSTSRNRTVSLEFAKCSIGESGNVAILFVMTIDPKLKLIPFADVEGYTAQKGEQEILFSMHAIFRIGQIKQIFGTPDLYEVQLALTSEDDPNMKKLHDYMDKSYEATSWHRIGWILHDMNQLDKSEEIYLRLLQRETNEKDQATWYHQLGEIKWRQGEYAKAKDCYRNALKIYKKVLPRFNSSLANAYNDLGLVYLDMGKYAKALSNLEQALAIHRKTLTDTHPNVATAYNNIGNVYLNMGIYPKALSNYEQALAIKRKTLPDRHPDFADSYNNIGNVYSNMGEYPKALSNLEQAQLIYKKTLPDTHPSLAASYHNIGVVYHRVKDYPTSLKYLERALRIREAALPADHPHITTCRQWIDMTKEEMNK